MRLTLRTLIAWLDDKLTPAEVREIGQQVNDSPFAKELVERIQRVTRQRRLTFPGDLGSEATDPALVASYLDNLLTPEQVGDYEKRCLTSDVHLAEVAAVHQILSLVGQKAKVPDDAKQRMYRMVRGRESTKARPESIKTASPAPRPKTVPTATRPPVAAPAPRPCGPRLGLVDQPESPPLPDRAAWPGDRPGAHRRPGRRGVLERERGRRREATGDELGLEEGEAGAETGRSAEGRRPRPRKRPSSPPRPRSARRSRSHRRPTRRRRLWPTPRSWAPSRRSTG